jgi:alkyl sulfatase BDS1-like metallo-beta-lactamase superfamily hydrolase
MVPTREVPPDVLIGDQHVFALGERQFELLWTPGGETRSALIVWLPNERIALVGNLFGPLFGNHPNLNTLRGDKPRSALEFIDSARRVRALKPELLLTGHEEIRGGEHIDREITRIINSVQWVHDCTVQGMNEGVDVRTLMRQITTPPELTLTEEYGKVAWNVRAIWHEYTGWFDPARGTTELYSVPATSIAPVLVDLVGGVGRLVERATEFVTRGKPLTRYRSGGRSEQRNSAWGQAPSVGGVATRKWWQELVGAYVDHFGDSRVGAVVCASPVRVRRT